MKQNKMISLMMTLCTIINDNMLKISNRKVKSDNFKKLNLFDLLITPFSSF